MSNTNGGSKAKDTASTEKSELTCGLIMPISLLDGCTAEHWAEVKSIVVEAVDSIPTPHFTTRLVSEADDVGVIQKRIVQNVYNSTLVVCDVSGKNPNVMFELGLRLAFDKPTIIIKDDKTDYSFDTGVIEHIPYPRDLRFGKIVEFKKKLAEKVLATYKASVEDPKHSPFLKSFGQFHVASLAQTEASPDKIMLEMLSDVVRDMQVIKRRMDAVPVSKPRELPSATELRAVLTSLADAYTKSTGRPVGALISDPDFCNHAIRLIHEQYGIVFPPSQLSSFMGVEPSK